MPFLYYSDTSPPVPLHLGLVLTHNIVPLNCSHLLPPLNLPLPFSPHCYIPLVSQPCTRQFHHGVELNYNIYPLLFCFILLFITICCTDFYSSVLCSILLSTSTPSCPCPLLHCCVRCIPTLHVVFLPCNSAGLQLPLPIVLFYIIHLLTKHFLTLSHFAHVSVLLRLAITQVRIPSIM
jgi:hypothetical protein